MALLAGAAFGQERPVVSAVRGFYRAYAAGDLAAAKEFWTAEAAPGFAAREARRLRVRCQRLDALEVRDVHVDGESANAIAEAWITRWSAMPGSVPEPERARSSLQLHRESGSWRIASWTAAEDELADRVAANGRDALIAEPSLWNRRLVTALARRAITAGNRDENERAARVTALAREVAEAIGDAGALAEVLGAESVLQRHPPNNDAMRAARTAHEAVAVAEEAHDPDVLARALLRRGNAQMAIADFTDVDSFERLLALADFIEQPSTLALAASGVTRSHLRDHHLRDALRTGLAAVDWARDAGDPASMISAEMTLAGNYVDRRDSALALPHALHAAELARQAGFDSIRASALRMVAVCYGIDEDGEMVGRVLDESLDPAIDLEPRTRIDLLLMRVGHRHETGDSAGAERDLEEARRVSAGVHGQPDARAIELATAWLRMHQGKLAEAMQYIDRAERVEGPEDVNLMRAYGLVAMGRPEEARGVFERALNWWESMRGVIDDQFQRSLFLDGSAQAYQSLVQLLVDLGQHREALAIAERVKARVLREMLRGGERTAVQDASVTELNAQVTALNRQLLAIERDGGNPAAVLARLRKARGALEEAGTRAEVPQTPAPVTAPFDLRTLRVPDGTVVLEYVVGENKTIGFLARAEHGDVIVKTRVIEIESRALRTMVRGFTRQIEQRDARYQPAARRLYDLLVAPLIGSTPSGARLCIIPDSVLWTLPFQALIAGDGRHLLEHAVVYYSPSLGNLDAPRRAHPGRAPTVLAMGDPDIDQATRSDLRSLGATGLGRLPEAEREVRELGRIYGARATVRTGHAAEEAMLKKHCGDYDVVHLATHGIVDEHSPMYSSLLLAGSATEDGLLEAREIIDLPLRADLVVLSACDTARGRIIAGEGVLGVSWAILATGTPRAIATQWPISSAAAARLMIAFHRRLAKRAEITSVAEALRDAQLEMLHRRDSAHPHYWAPFVLIGSDR